ncbi:MAG: type II toxin-antitoxin system RelB/DinJ family antitoxin [Oscillospiraceae bacterium]|nr:type II toxin-antitoxin system RelB/DinJ family antitoxin [Oscillospiraceae bacterium]
MAMDATLQIRMDKEIKSQVEALYRGMGTSFAEAVRIFAQQSLREGGMPFRPTLKTWDELSQQDIDKKLAASMDEAASGQVYTQAQLDEIMTERFHHG